MHVNTRKKAQFGWLTRHLMSNMGTLVFLGLLLLTQSMGAEPPEASTMQGTTATLLSYQGTLTDASGNPINGNVNMGFALYHEAEGGTPFWTETYTGSQAIEVINGLFHVLLGSQTALDPADLTGDLYLGITVNGEEMLPRELLTSVVKAVQASLIDEDLDMRHNSIDNVEALTVTGNNIYLGGTGPGGVVLRQDGSRTLHLLPWGGQSYDYDTVCIGCGAKAGLDVHGDLWVQDADLAMRYSGRGDGGIALAHWLDDSLVINWDGSFAGGVLVHSDMDMGGNSISNCGALTEANLQTPEELAAKRIGRFEKGDVLCWAGDRLEKCVTANDLLVQAVADENGRPIVIGAEVVRALGPVKVGDLLVASEVPGYAMVNNNPRSGTVIAQALENIDKKQGLVKAMIRKW